VGVRAGKFSEAAACYITALGNGSLDGVITKPKNMVETCRAFEKNAALPRSMRIQVPRALLPVYELRNNSGFAHVASKRIALKSDARLMSQTCRWVFSVICDAYSNMSGPQVDQLVEFLSNAPVEAVWTHGDTMAVTIPGLTVREEVLLLLASHASGSISVDELSDNVDYANKSRFKREMLPAMQRDKQIKLLNGAAHILPAGIERANAILSKGA
jgi:hypothetical protein